MNNSFTTAPRAIGLSVHRPWPVLLAIAALAVMEVRADVHLPVLKTASGVYSNVQVFNRTTTHLSFAHAKGVAVIKLKDIAPESMEAMTNPAAAASAAGTVSAGSPDVAMMAYEPVSDVAQIKSLAAAFPRNPALEKLIKGRMRMVLYTTLAALVVGWLFFCYCCSQICKKAHTEPGLMVWLPVLQIFPLLKAARMPLWWFLLWFVPVLNLVAQVLWCIKIAEARGKSPWVGIFLILPVTNLFAFLYLAFSSPGGGEEDSAPALGGPRPIAAMG